MKYFICILFCLAIASCDLVVDIDVPFEKKQLVVNCDFNPEEVWSSYISLNKHILDTLEHARVTNAFVVVYENDQPIDTLVHVENGKYESDFGKPFAGKTYSIRVQAENYETATAQSLIPNVTPIDNVTVTEPVRGSMDYRTEIEVAFSDNLYENNFYQIKVFSRFDRLGEDFQVEPSLQIVETIVDDPSENIEVTDWRTGVLLKDAFFNGKKRVLSMKTRYPGGSNFIVELRTLSKDYYDYYITRSLQEASNGDPLSQPINVYSNIENGFGIFAGYAVSKHAATPEIRPIIVSASSTTVSRGDVITLELDNVSEEIPGEYLMVILKSAERYVYASPIRTSSSTLQFRVPETAISGKVGVVLNGFIGVSDFELEIVD
jgi:hypothetical protein